MKSFLCFTLLFFTSTLGISQEVGKPFIRNFPADEYFSESQNWVFVEDNRGMVYIGNSANILEYDGEAWRVIELPNAPISRALAKDKNGVVYVGSQTTFGYLGACF